MALEDIVYSEGDIQNFIVEEARGDIGTVEAIMTEPDSNSGIPCNEIPESGGENDYTFS